MRKSTKKAATARKGAAQYYNHEELAWAAGFFDGEGSSSLIKRRRGLGVAVSISQADDGARTASVLQRFHKAIGGLGRVGKRGSPEKPGKRKVHRATHNWRTNSFEESQAVVALLWKYLSENKRKQAAHTITEVVKWRRKNGRPGRAKYKYRPQILAVAQRRNHVEQAWAAGFFDGEGSAYLRIASRRKDGTLWRARRVSVGQKDSSTGTAPVLLRFQRAVGGKGYIEIHKAAKAHKWRVDDANDLETVTKLLWPFLSRIKQLQIETVQATFRQQLRRNGTSEICKRGHSYSGTTWRGGHLRKVCHLCARDCVRARARSKGAKARIFKNPEERARKVASGMYRPIKKP